MTSGPLSCKAGWVIPACLVFFTVFPAAAGQDSPELPLFIGSYTKPGERGGIFRTLFDPGSGAFGPLETAADAPNSSFLAATRDGRFLFAVSEGGAGSVAAFERGPTPALTLLNRQPSGGSGPCHLSLDPQERALFAANYNSGSVAVFPVFGNGSLGEPAAVEIFQGSGPHPARQKQPHAHWIGTDPSGRWVLVCDLGSDKIRVFRFSSEGGKLSLAPADPPWAGAPAGSGPRHLAFHPSGRFVFVNNELAMTVTAFAWDSARGVLREIGTVPLLPEGAPSGGATSAAIACHPGGRFLYVSNRGVNTLSVFSVSPEGALSLIQHTPAGVDTPRGFALAGGGRWLLVAGQNDNRLVSRPVSPETGLIGPVTGELAVPAPVAVLPPAE